MHYIEICFQKKERLPPVVNNSDKKIISIGNASTGNSQAGKIYSINGIFTTICACTHGYAIGYILDDTKFNYQICQNKILLLCFVLNVSGYI